MSKSDALNLANGPVDSATFDAGALNSMLDAHVKFELDRWSGDRLVSTLGEEVAALFEWLGTVPLGEVVTPELAGVWITKYAVEIPLTDEAVALAGALARSAHAAALDSDTTVREVLPREVFDDLAAVGIGMKGVRTAITDQVTTSEVYSRLIAHVLYHGIKNYLLTESVIARKVPGASSLMKLGQSALSSAAPNLEKNIDRQLTSFVNSNIQDSIRESRHYLDTVLDEELLGAVADEVWKTNADSTLAEAASLVPAESLEALVESGRAAWLHLRSTPVFTDIASQVAADFLTSQGDRTIGELLASAGVTPQLATELASQAAAPFIARAVHDGYLEARIRARLGEFYASYAS